MSPHASTPGAPHGHVPAGELDPDEAADALETSERGEPSRPDSAPPRQDEDLISLDTPD